MNYSSEKIKAIVSSCIEDFNDISDVQLDVNVDAPVALYGKGGDLSSVDLVTLLTIVEEEIGSQFDIEYSFDTGKALSLAESPFQDTDKLIEFIVNQLNETEVSA